MPARTGTCTRTPVPVGKSMTTAPDPGTARTRRAPSSRLNSRGWPISSGRKAQARHACRAVCPRRTLIRRCRIGKEVRWKPKGFSAQPGAEANKWVPEVEDAAGQIRCECVPRSRCAPPPGTPLEERMQSHRAAWCYHADALIHVSLSSNFLNIGME